MARSDYDVVNCSSLVCWAGMVLIVNRTLLGTIKSGKHNMQIGTGERRFEFVYMDRLCEAHTRAAKAVLRGHISLAPLEQKSQRRSVFFYLR